MRTLTAQQTAIIASEVKTDISWLFEVDRTGNGSVDDYWSTKAKTWNAQPYTFAIMDFSPLQTERNRSEYGISAPPVFNFTVTNKNTTLYPSDFTGGNVTLRRVIKAWVRKAVVTVTGGTKPVAGETMTGATSGKTAVVLGPPDAWAGAVSVYFVSQSGAFQAENVSFTGGGTGTIAADLTYAEEEAEESVWSFDFVSVAPEYQTLRFECQSWIEKYLNGVYPNTQTLDSLWPSDQNDYTGCVPLIFGTCYIPLHTALIAQDRYYILGPAGPAYTITKSRSPIEVDTVTEWLPAGYTFAQSTKAGADGNNYRVFQLLGTETVSEDPSNVLYKLWNSVFGGLSETSTRTVNVGASYLALPTKFSRDDTAALTTPTGAIHYILEDFGIPTGKIDDPSRVIAAATIAGWGLTWNPGIYSQEDRKVLLASLCTQCHLELIIRDKVYFKVHSKTSQRTVTATDIIEGSFAYRVNKKELSNCGYASYPDPSGNVPVSKLTRTLVPAKAATTQKSNVEVDCAFVSSGSVHAQIVAQLTLQRKLLPEADVTFNAKGFLLALEPDDVITMSGDNYGAGAGHTYSLLIDSVSVSKDLEVSITGTRFSAALDDFADLAPSVAVVGVDGVAGIYKVVVCGPEAPGQAPADDPTIFGGVIKASTNVGMSGLVSGAVDWRIWAGASFANRATAPFRVDDNGNLYATSATISGMVSGSYIYGSSLMTKGTYLASSCLAAAATLNVGNTTDFPNPNPGVTNNPASFIDSANDRDAFTYNDKTATTLLGCIGVLAHTVSAANKPLVVPAVKGMYISDAANEMRFFGNRGDGTVEELVSIGDGSSGFPSFGVFGSQDATNIAIYARSKTNAGIQAISDSFYGVYGYSNSSHGVHGISVSGYAVYSAGTTYLGGNATILDASWLGLGAAKGRILFTDAATDTLTFSDCNLILSGGTSITTPAESWIGPSSTAGVYFKGGFVGIGFTAPLSGLCVDSLHVGSESAAGANNLLVDGTISVGGLITSTAGNNVRVFYAASATTGYQMMDITNGTGRAIFGQDGSVAGSLVTGGLAYATVLAACNANALHLGTDQISRVTIYPTTGHVFIPYGLHIGVTGATDPGDNNLLVDGTIHVDGVATLASAVIEGNATANSMGLIQGDATGGRVLRRIRIPILDGTTAATIKPSSVSLWNGDVNGAENNLAKSGDTGNFTLNADGSILCLQTSGISGDAITVLAVELTYNFSGTAIIPSGYISGTDLYISFTNATTGANVDLTTLVDTGNISVAVTYLTSA